MKVRSSPPYLPVSKLVASAFLEPMGPSHQSPLQPQHETALDTTTSESQRQPILDISHMSLHNYRCTRRRLNRSVTCSRPIVEELMHCQRRWVGMMLKLSPPKAPRHHTTPRAHTFSIMIPPLLILRIESQTKPVCLFRFSVTGGSDDHLRVRLHQRFASVFGVRVSPRGYSAALIPVARFRGRNIDGIDAASSNALRDINQATRTNQAFWLPLLAYPHPSPSREFWKGKLASQPRYLAASLLSR
jgi:hypothetical protein